jgi:acyl-coenzyme A thioesterase PaaI-like protein
MLMLIRNLGEEFVVWDRAATIRFLRPARTTLFATFRLPADLIEEIRAEAIRVGRLNRDFEIELQDAAGETYATCTKTLYIRRKGER